MPPASKIDLTRYVVVVFPFVPVMPVMTSECWGTAVKPVRNDRHRLPRIRHLDNRAFAGFNIRIGNYSGRSSTERFGNEYVTVDRESSNREKQRSGAHFTGNRTRWKGFPPTYRP